MTKKVALMDTVRFTNVPKFDELSVKNIFPRYINDPEMTQFIPDWFQKYKEPSRKYFSCCPQLGVPIAPKHNGLTANKNRRTRCKQASERRLTKETTRVRLNSSPKTRKLTKKSV